MTNGLARLVALEQKATPRPWGKYDGWGPSPNLLGSPEDYEFLVVLRNAAPALLRIVEAARAVEQHALHVGLNDQGTNSLMAELAAALVALDATEDGTS